jgi:hypothetical protein
MTMTVLAKSALPLSAAIILALSGCNTGSAASHAGGTPTATTQQPAPDASDASDGATASDGSGTSSPAASGHLHACLLVSEQDATTALGADPGTGHEETQESALGGSGTCNYQIESGGLQVSASSVAGKALCDGNRQPNSVDVPGVGDRAFETPATSAQEATVYFLKGDTCVSITIETTASMGSPKDRVIALATTAAGRL